MSDRYEAFLEVFCDLFLKEKFSFVLREYDLDTNSLKDTRLDWSGSMTDGDGRLELAFTKADDS